MSSAPCAVLSGVTRSAGAPQAPKITLLERSQPTLPFPDGALGCERAFDPLQTSFIPWELPRGAASTQLVPGVSILGTAKRRAVQFCVRTRVLERQRGNSSPALRGET